jgi:hypothetical protein
MTLIIMINKNKILNFIHTILFTAFNPGCNYEPPSPVISYYSKLFAKFIFICVNSVR